MKEYTHTFAVEFTVKSPHKSAKECLRKQKLTLIAGLERRIRDVFEANEYLHTLKPVETKGTDFPDQREAGVDY